MASAKRKHAADLFESSEHAKSKKSKLSAIKLNSKHEKNSTKSAKIKKRPIVKTSPDPTDLDESDTTESENGFYGFSAKETANNQLSEESSDGNSKNGNGVVINETPAQQLPKGKKVKNIEHQSDEVVNNGMKDGSLTTSSREAHAKQKELAKERRASKPNAEIILRSKRLWERLRRKSHIPKDERKQLVDELFSIVNGRVHEFVFKHDSVRVIQCALKYANSEQKTAIAKELKGEYKDLAQSKYAKFLVAKLVVDGNAETREMIIKEFYGHVRRLINHPEAAWIIDDIYRGIATQKQKAILLREWYGPEFAIFKTKDEGDVSSDLSSILLASPEKRKPIMSYLYGLINQLIQKKLTGFTMLHDAMLQYFQNTKPSSEEASEFICNLQSDEESDLLKNLAFTLSGSHVICLALAYGSAKDRRHILKAYKDIIELLAYDPYGYKVLLTIYDVVDDTVMVSKSIISELITRISPKSTEEQIQKQHETIVTLAMHNTARTTILYPFTGPAKRLLPPGSTYLNLLPIIEEIRVSTSKKPAKTRHAELRATLIGPLLSTIAARAKDLSKASFGCLLMAEALLAASSIADNSGSNATDNNDKTTSAAAAIAALCAGSPETDEMHIANSAAGSRMLKTLIAGGHYDPALGKVVRSEQQQKTPEDLASTPGTEEGARAGTGKEFAAQVWQVIKKDGMLKEWACGSGSFVIVALLETEGFEEKEEILAALKKVKKELKEVAKSSPNPSTSKEKNGDEKKIKRDRKGKKEKQKKGDEDEKDTMKNENQKGNAGAVILLRILDSEKA